MTTDERLQIIEDKLDKIFCELVAHTHASPEYFQRQTDMLRLAMSQPLGIKEP